MSDQEARNFLESIMPTREQVESFIKPLKGADDPGPNSGFAYHPVLGWVHRPSARPNGWDGGKWFADYDPDGARRCVNGSGKACRIHTYGDSFTHSSQVNDGESWQEFLAAHICEPIRNYGVGGFSVYQAYRRMLLVEAQTPADYIILNIYDDDHYRNLDAWRSIRWGNSTVGTTLPHVRVDVAKDRFEERANLLARAEDVYNLCDKEFVWKSFKDDMVLQVMLATKGNNKAGEEWREPPETIFGLAVERTGEGDAVARVQQAHTDAALFASRRVVQLFESYCEKQQKKFMVILSFGRGNLRRALAGEERFDRDFLPWIQGRGYPVCDMLGDFVAEFEKSSQSPEDFIARYYIGHHTPAGNHFTAMAIKRTVVDWLDPKPAPYA